MSNTSYKTHNYKKLQKTNFDIINFENLPELEGEEILTRNHKVDFYALIFITENNGKHSIDFKDYDYSKGTILAIRKDQMHRFYLNKDTKGFLLCFKEEFLNSYLNEIEVSSAIQMFNELLVSPKTQFEQRDFKGISQLIKGIEKEVLVINDIYSYKLIRSLLHILITLIYRLKSKEYNNNQQSKYLKDFIKFQNILEEDYCKTKKVYDYASKLGFSTKKLNTVVKFIANKPAKEFIDDTVVIKVKRLLLQYDLSIKEIAFKVGFKDPTNLHKYFKKHTSLTPEEFRKKYPS
ncbi:MULTISPECIES: AraC family transcriptional regulator [Tenacibaculum]|uniref:AraC family transcriptional regulator n=1 Tax=Tenacibaculum TaxID=104267 RepID=UPI001F0B4C21|nr:MULTISPECIES: helix-turn-helix transcriptional regulator [Tenacibaculum]MCH3881307.1 AraC family transcriptional regulator [Tenacibaculum aquimarinum]MCH3883835.1 AraC family transcriptional regulator [Tenacibaculum aquimarinum]MDO6599099.1 helix-turn-helix transcriptional regulator [Tenacibaculum sp. 1_MG-2023]